VPREKIQLRETLESIRILKPDGTIDKADEKLVPKIPDDDLLKLFKTVLNSRMFDERCFMMQRQGRIGTYGPTKGQEVASLAFAYCIGKDDWLCPSFRETCAMLWRGWPMDKIILWWAGHEIGSAVPEGINDLPICVPVASQCQYAMGIAWALKLQKTKNVCVAFVGDGGTSEGDFHEAMNFAAVYNAPLIQIVQNNHWAISIPREAQTKSPTIAQKAIAYGMNAFQVDGNDIFACVAAGREAVERARKGEGPTLIEAVTYRLGVHTTADDPKKYRKEEDVKPWEGKDPLIRFRIYLQNKGLLTDKLEEEMREEINARLNEAVAKAEGYKANKTEFLDYQFATPTPDLIRQKQELEEYLNWDGKVAGRTEMAPAH
jgi:pyruvate dehydrogenase E1 component alpha subunit